MPNINQLLKTIILSDTDELLNIGTFTAVNYNPTTEKFAIYFSHKNMVDKKAYSSLMFLRNIVDTFFTDVFGNKEGKVTPTSGSTESILLALYYAREKARYEKGIKKPNIIIPKSAHYSFQNCAKFLNIEVRTVSLNEKYQINTDKVKEHLDKNTILIVGIMGSTELGVIDDLATLNTICEAHDIDLHIDAAIGGFIIPFIQTPIPFSFTHLTKMFSMNISGHKFGLALPGSGILLMKDKNIIENYAGSLEYLSSGESLVENLLITQSSLGVVSLGINILEYKKTGYKQFAERYISIKDVCRTFCAKYDIPFFEGSPFTPQFYLYPKDVITLSKYLSEKSWIQSVYLAKGFPKPGIRVVIKRGQEDLIKNELLADIKYYYTNKRSTKKLSGYSKEEVHESTTQII